MASLLRSCKFVRYFAGIARNFAFGSGRQDTFDASVISNTPNLYSGLAIRALATQTVNVRHDSSLERSLRRLDQDARRAGRISRRELDEVLEEIKQTRSATSSQSLMVIRCCGSLVPEELPEVRTKLVQEIWNTLEALGVPMDISHYNALLRVYLENEHPFSPSEFLAELERKGVEPNRVTYQRLVARHCQQADMEGAAKVLQIMRDQQLPVNESVFNALVNGHAQAGDMESARGILGVMKQAGLEPGPETYTALLVGHAQQGDMEAIRAVLAECEAQKIDLLDRDFLTVIHALATSEHTQYIEELMGHLKKRVGYNQDCVNLILRLVNVGKEDVGLQLLNTLSPITKTDSQEPAPTGSFFIRQLIKANRPNEKVIEICLKLQNEGKHPRALLVALESALSLGNHETAIAYATALKSQNLPLRQHYFWPLLAHHAKNKNSDGVCEVLRNMISLGVIPQGETLCDYAIPGLAGKGDSKVSQLRSVGISVGSAACAVALNLLFSNKIKEAAEIVSQYRATYGFNIFRRSLLQAFAATSDVPSFIKFVQCIVGSLKTASSEEVQEDQENDAEAVNRNNDPAVIVGKLVLDSFRSMHTNKMQTLQAILEGLVESGLNIDAGLAEQLQEKIGADLTPELSSLLSKLTSGSLVPNFSLGEQAFSPAIEGRDLERLLQTLEAKNLPANNVKKQLLQHYCRIKDLEKAAKLKKDLEAQNFIFLPGVLAGLLELYCHHNMLEEVLEVQKELKEKHPDFQLDPSKSIKFAAVLINNDRFEEGLELVKAMTVKEGTDGKEDRFMFILRNSAWQLLNSIAEKGKVEELQSVFEALVGGGKLPVTNVLLGPLIKVHLMRDDVKGALERFEWCCVQHHSTPWKNELACRLIHAEDPVALQRLTDLSTQVHGEVNSLYDLVLAFVECGRVRQARRILETPGLRSRPYRLSSACQRYSDEGQVSSLEGLVEATKDLSHIDRDPIYQHLLNTYCKSDEVDKALGLWTQAQEEDVSPSDEFLLTLGSLLKKHGRPIPFVMPEVVKSATPTSTTQQTKQKVTKPLKSTKPVTARPAAESDELTSFRQAIQTKNVDKALEMKQTLKSQGKPLSVRDYSLLVESITHAERVGELSRELQEMLAQGTHPLPRIFRFALNKIALAGDIEALNNIGQLLDEDKKRLVSFDNRMCNAHIIAGRAKDYISTLSSNLEAATTPEDLANVFSSFPRGGALGILEKHPELEQDYAQVAAKYAEKGEIGPINVLWMQYFVTGRREEAMELWEKYLNKAPRLMFQWICQVARRTTSPALASDLFALLASSPESTPGAKGNALSCLLDVLTSQERYDDALASLTAARTDVGLDHVNRTALQRLKDGLEAQGKTFPFTIPPKSASKSSSSSSSDDDNEKRH